jgi:hypothetical protein
MTNGQADLVRPGDLIRAETFNAILLRLAELVDRVDRIEEQLGSGDGPRIVRITPDQPHVGDEMRIIGSNFDFTIGAFGVSFDGVSVSTFKPGSAENVLIFDVPNIPVPEGGRAVTLRVVNRTTSTTRTIFVLPRVGPPQPDQIDLLPLGAVGADTPVAGQPFTLAFRLSSRSGRAVLLTLSATVPELGVVPEFRDDAGLLPSPAVRVPAGGTVAFSLRLTVPAGAAAGTSFTVLVRADGPGLTVDSGILSFAVGAAAPASDPDIDAPTPDGVSAPAQLNGSSVTLPRGKNTELTVVTGFRRAGDYTFTVSDATNGWRIATDLGSDTGGPITVTPADIDNSLNRTKLVPTSIFLTAPPAPTTTAVPLTLSVTEVGRDETAQRVLQLLTD